MGLQRPLAWKPQQVVVVLHPGREQSTARVGEKLIESMLFVPGAKVDGEG